MPLSTSNLLPKTSTAPNPLMPLNQQPKPSIPTGGSNIGSSIGGLASSLFNSLSNIKAPTPPTGYVNPMTKSTPGLVTPNQVDQTTQSAIKPTVQPTTNQTKEKTSITPVQTSPTATQPTSTPTYVDALSPTKAPQSNDQVGGTGPVTNPNNTGFGYNSSFTSPSATFPGLVNQLATSVNNNQALGNNAQQIAQKAAEDYGNVTRQGILASGGNLSSGLSPVGQGLASQIAANTGALQQGITQQENAALAGNAQALNAQGQTQSGLGTAISATQPVAGATFFGNQLTGGLVGGAGNASGTGVTGNTLIDGSVSKALQAIQNGASFNDATALLVGGDIAKQALLTQMSQLNGGSTPNITAQNAVAGQNVQQGIQTGNQAYNLNLGLQQLKQLEPLATQFIQGSGLNSSDSPLYNKPINQYIKNLGNTAAGQQAQAIMTDIQTAGQQIIANKAPGTPTSAVEQQAANDPSLLSASQLQSVLRTWDLLGQTTQSVLQQQSTNSLGGQHVYSGPQASPATNIPVASPNTSPGSGVQTPLGQATAGTALNLGSWGLGQISNLGSEIIGFIGRGLMK